MNHEKRNMQDKTKGGSYVSYEYPTDYGYDTFVRDTFWHDGGIIFITQINDYAKKQRIYTVTTIIRGDVSVITCETRSEADSKFTNGKKWLVRK